MHKQLVDLLQKDMSRKEFLIKLGFATATLIGFGTLIKTLTGQPVVKNIATQSEIADSSSIQGIASGGVLEVATATGLTILDYGAKCDADKDNLQTSPATATDDTAAILAMINSLGYATVPAFRWSRISSLTLLNKAVIIMSPGSRLVRENSSPDENPLVTFTANHQAILGMGGATLEVRNKCPNGVVRFDHPDPGACQWCRLTGIHVKGPGKDVAESVGVYFSAPLPAYDTVHKRQPRPNSTFQNRCSDLTVSDVETGVRLTEGANVNQISGLSFVHIGKTIFDLEAALESSISNITASGSPGATVIRLRNNARYNNFTALAVEPGSSEVINNVTVSKPSTGYVIDAECNDNMIQGIINTSSLGVDNGTGSVIVTHRANEIGHMSISKNLFAAKPSYKDYTQTTLLADPDLSLKLYPNTYVITGEVYYTADTTADMKLQLNVGSGLGGGTWSIQALATSSTTNTGAMICASSSVGAPITIGGAGGSKVCARISGRITMTGSGNLSLLCAQNAASAVASRVLGGSWLRVEAVG
jgi:hypothetical protein